jgi:hypothetical protein
MTRIFILSSQLFGPYLFNVVHDSSSQLYETMVTVRHCAKLDRTKPFSYIVANDSYKARQMKLIPPLQVEESDAPLNISGCTVYKTVCS